MKDFNILDMLAKLFDLKDSLHLFKQQKCSHLF